MEKHYNIDYLTETAKILGTVKEKSYECFKDVYNGTVIDLGCGTGNDVVNMAKLFAQNGLELIGIDHDVAMIKKAEDSKEGLVNVKFLLGDALNLPFTNASVKGIRMERLVQHVADFARLFDEVYRLLEKGGVIVILESDWKSFSLYNGDSVVADKLNRYLWSTKVNNGGAAQSLTAYLRAYRFDDVKLEVLPFILSSYQEACTYLWLDVILNEMLSKGLLHDKEHNLFVEALDTADKNGFFRCSMNFVIATARKK